ncbi:hypothetical protein BV25DRAFT_1836073 [Artomyces pyxidatus]|uniref:Uncharacterized protein n=1 Tax=Artomyces pyxidatus TaxID=48021 RepID=A0ACB8TCI4_9AGAM|nr:hypothetical protein BV25DRAFT_1836073 [Artomyces pyxidatus]
MATDQPGSSQPAVNEGVFNDPVYEGLDTDLLVRIATSVPPNPLTGRVEPDDIMQWVLKHPELPGMDKLFGDVARAYERINDFDPAQYDYESLAKTVEPGSAWYLSLDFRGLVDADKQRVDAAHADSTPGVQPHFTLMSRAAGQFVRYIKVCFGLPASSDVLDFVQRSICAPNPPLKAELPSYLLLSIKFAPHMEVLTPFLASLPAPFTWELESRELNAKLSDVMYAGLQVRFDAYVGLAEEAKKVGNAAFAAKDRAGAVSAYSDALERLEDALRGARDEERAARGVRLAAVLLANRAAAYLREGEGADPALALKDAERAEEVDPSYVKSYFRQVRAHEMLGEPGKARGVVERALQRPDLKESKDLLELLAKYPPEA